MTRIHLLLVRHVDSLKNRRRSFSSADDGEAMTERGRWQAKALAAAIAGMREQLNLTIQSVYAARSERAEATASSIAETLKVPVRVYDQLRSIKLADIAGVSETIAIQTAPEFMQQMDLYRAGVLNSYNIRTPLGSEDHHGFERRIAEAMDEILAVQDEELKVVVAHRSSLTAMLIRLARCQGVYPPGFYGHVPLGLGSVSYATQSHEGIWSFVRLNSRLHTRHRV